MKDADTTIASLRNAVQVFVDERDWKKYHTPKNLAMSLAIEAAELMRHFQWLHPDESFQAVESSTTRAGISEELADVICYALSLANTLQIDLSTAVTSKIKKNAVKYPVERYHGRYRAD